MKFVGQGIHKLEPANRIYPHFLLLWPWPWPDNLDIQKRTSCTSKNEVSRWRFSKVRARTGQTDRHIDAPWLFICAIEILILFYY